MREEKASPAFRVTCALGQKSRWPEALNLLAEMRAVETSRRPKLGAYQRWVREVNAADGDPEQLAMLDAILRLAVGSSRSSAPPPKTGHMQQVAPWQAGTAEPASEVVTSVSSAADTSDGSAKTKSNEPVDQEGGSVINRMAALIATRRSESAAAKAAAPFGPGSWSVIAHEAAHERQPPNHFDLDIYNCMPGVVALTSSAPQACKKHDVPGIEGAFSLSNVFSAAECEQLRSLTEAIGYRPDVPVSSPIDERAQNVVLYASDEQSEALFSRVRDLLPQEIAGQSLMGLNRRWRLYRYQEGNAYRKHLDGAWPASGMRNGADGKREYLYDAHGGNTRSRYTFIVYLNDDFEGGATTFFVPKEGSEGTLESRPVRPRTGFATVFPHGETGVPLLHEGSPVVKGTKYLLRTDVVYTAPESSQAMKDAKRLRGLARQLGGLGGKDLMEEAMAGVEDGKAGTKAKVIKGGLKKKSKFSEKMEQKSGNAVDSKGGKSQKVGHAGTGKRAGKKAGKAGRRQR